MEIQQIQDLIRKYNTGQCTAEEKLLLEQWYLSFEWDSTIVALNENELMELKNEAWRILYKRKQSEVLADHAKVIAINHKKQYWWYAAATIISLLAAAGIIYQFMTPADKPAIVKNTTQQQQNTTQQPDILPGNGKARLMMADGSVITLDSLQTANFKEKDGTQIQKKEGKLIYDDATSKGEEVLYNTLSTPRGGEYQLVLPDGSKVWLNATSSIKFPTRFEGKERTVFLHGEAYFEVAKNNKMLFQVKLDNDVAVQVVGTHFNIMGYEDENEVRTTLAEGIVKVTSPIKTVLLSPSQQAIMKRRDQSLAVSNADVAKALAWKNGMIEFDGDDLPAIMRQLSRWYDVDVSFSGAIPKGTYKGAIRRLAPLSKVLEILRAAGVQFKLKDRKLTVTGG